MTPFKQFLARHGGRPAFREPSPAVPPVATAEARAVKALRELVRAVEAYDAEMDDKANGGRDAVPPEGDDYNEIVGLVRLAKRQAFGEG